MSFDKEGKYVFQLIFHSNQLPNSNIIVYKEIYFYNTATNQLFYL